SGLVPESEQAVLQRSLRGGECDVVAVELPAGIRELQGDPLARRVQARGAGESRTAPESQAVTASLWPLAHHHLGQGQRIDLPAAVRILVVDEAVAVVALTVAANLVRRRSAARNFPSAGAAGAAASAPHRAAPGATAGPAPRAGPCASLDGSQHAAPGNAAHVGRAGIGIVAIRRRRAARTAPRG